MKKVIAQANLPASVIANYQGTAAAFEGSLSNEGLLILAALVTVYIVLGVLYESFVHPVTILSTLPSAGVGALLALMLFHLDLDIVAIIGIILLIGIVKKNGIMMVDFALEAERTGGKNATDAIYEASLLRFRPIMMTTMAALLSGIPLAFGTGIGSELRRPLGVAMVGGLIFSQVLTLYTTPVIYIFFDNLGARFARRRRQQNDAGQPGDEPGMNPSRIFIERPVATTLLTVAVAMAGAIAFIVLPVSPLPQVDFPTITVAASLARRESGHHGVLHRHAAGAAVRAHRRRHRNDLFEHARHNRRDAAVRSEPRYQRRRARRGGRHQRGAHLSSRQSSGQSDLSQSEPGRLAHHGARPAIGHLRRPGALRRSIHGDGAAHIADLGRRRGAGGGSVAARGAHRAQSRTNSPATESACRPCSKWWPAKTRTWPRVSFPTAIRPPTSLPTTRSRRPPTTSPWWSATTTEASVRLQDIADVIDSQQSVRQAGFLNGKPSVNMIIFRQPGANIIKTVDLIKAAIPSLQATIKRGQHLITILDRTLTIRASVSDIERTLIISVVLVIAVVFVFLRNVRATFIPAVAVPVSLIGTCAIMYLAGFSLDNLSLMALAIASGFVVDDAIVVMENITRHLEARHVAPSRPPSRAQRRSASPFSPSAFR